MALPAGAGLGLTLDPSHYYAEPNQGASFDALYPLVRGTGFRAGGMSWQEIQLPWGQVPIDCAAVVRRLEAARYRGFYVAEYIEGFNSVDPICDPAGSWSPLREIRGHGRTGRPLGG